MGTSFVVAEVEPILRPPAGISEQKETRADDCFVRSLTTNQQTTNQLQRELKPTRNKQQNSSSSISSSAE